MALSYSAFVHFALGRAGEALRRVRRAVELARELSHPRSLAMALTFHAWVRYFRREAAEALGPLEELEELAERDGFRNWWLHAPPMRAWALAALGRTDEGLAAADAVDVDSLLGRRMVGMEPYLVQVLAEAFLDGDRPESAEPVLTRLLGRLEDEAPDVWWMPEVYRVHARVLARLGRDGEACERLERATATARVVGTPIFLLRAILERAHVRGGLLDHRVLELACIAIKDEDLPELQEARALLNAPSSGAELVRV